MPALPSFRYAVSVLSRPGLEKVVWSRGRKRECVKESRVVCWSRHKWASGNTNWPPEATAFI